MEQPRTWPAFVGDWHSKILQTGKSLHLRRRSRGLDGELGRRELTNSIDYQTSASHVSSRVGRLVAILTRTLSLLWILVPRRGRPLRTKALHELHALAYLDALRGYLAMIIYTGHTMSRRWNWLPTSVLAIPWTQFPFRGGHMSLDMFFWISGYAMTYRLIGFIQTKKQDKFLDVLVSTLFRRYLRLFLPVVCVELVTVFAVWSGLAILPPQKDFVHIGNPLVYWVKDTAHMMNPFAHVTGWFVYEGRAGSELLDPFWSINTEFRSSLILLMFLTATCKMTSSKRQLLTWLCIPAFLAWQAQWAAMAFVGMWFAERRQGKVREREAQKSLTTIQPSQGDNTPIVHDVQNEKRDSSIPKQTWSTNSTLNRLRQPWTTSDQRQRLSTLRQPLLILLFLYSFIVIQDPRSITTKTSFPHNLINSITPAHWADMMKMHFHLIIGGFMMLYPLDQLYMLQRPLLTPFSQYLGELSFGIYAVHYTVRWIVWEPRYVKWQSDRYGADKFDRFWVLFPAHCVMTIIVLWAADLFRRLDTRVVFLCKDLESWFFE